MVNSTKICEHLPNCKGYKLNEYGIYKTDTDSPSEVNVDISTEEDIFKVLGLDYIPPEQRLQLLNLKSNLKAIVTYFYYGTIQRK